MKTANHKILSYFERTAKEFDSIYEKKQNFIKKIINLVFRRGMHRRLLLALKECDQSINTILDVGCGSGRITLPLAEKGLKVTGIDYSIGMISLAKKYQKAIEKERGKSLSIKWICGDFLKDFNPPESYDAVIALGFFDYVENPVSVLKKTKGLAIKKIISSFPARYVFQMPIRKIWLLKRKCPVYFYTQKKIKKIYAQAGIHHYSIKKIPAGYLVTSVMSDKNIT